jgi:hypothetical protein
MRRQAGERPENSCCERWINSNSRMRGIKLQQALAEKIRRFLSRRLGPEPAKAAA